LRLLLLTILTIIIVVVAINATISSIYFASDNCTLIKAL